MGRLIAVIFGPEESIEEEEEEEGNDEDRSETTIKEVRATPIFLQA